MSLGGMLASLFPLIYLVLNLGWLGYGLTHNNWLTLPILFCGIYLIPLLCFRIHNLFFKIEDGEYDLSRMTYNPWWTTHMLQYPFIAFPFFESILHFVPGLYTLWLRAWGAKIGRKIFWTPRTEIIDRSLVEIGDYTLIGHMTIMVSHLVENRSGHPKLVLKKIVIGKKCLIGADSQLGPGTLVPDGTNLKPKSRLYWKGEWK